MKVDLKGMQTAYRKVEMKGMWTAHRKVDLRERSKECPKAS